MSYFQRRVAGLDRISVQGMLPAEAQDHERIRAHLNSALNAMNSVVEGIPLQYAQPGQAAAAGAGYGYAGIAGEAMPTLLHFTFTNLEPS